MRPPSPFPPATAFQMPLRDAMRGVATLADLTEDMLEPVANLLPEPLRRPFEGALKALDDAGHRFISGAIGMAEISVASDVLMGKEGDGARAETCAMVLAFAWERVRQACDLPHHQMVSETILAAQLSGAPAIAGETAAERAANLLSAIRTSGAIGRAPGVTRHHSPEEQREIDTALVAAMVWLLAIRGETLEEEERLLDLALALSRALQADVLTAVEEPGQLARQLQQLSAHL
ncbi:MAG: hypothetical protein AAGJ74_01535 [Pseudomonadota bacterium]